jgi:hypothetical protein
MNKEYIANGLVYGKIWGGDFGAYKSMELRAKTRAEILKTAKKELKSGGLDSGMGFEYLKGAYLSIEQIETVNLKGKEFKHSEYIDEFIGDLTDKEQDFLLTCEF